jgi:hypothetical protein
MFTSEPTAESPIRQQQARIIPILSKQLNELDSTFQLPEGPYTFEHECQARDIMEAAYAEYVSSSATPNKHQAIIHLISTCANDGAIQEGSGIEDAGGLGGLGDAVIAVRVDIQNWNGEEAEDSEVIVDLDNDQRSTRM